MSARATTYRSPRARILRGPVQITYVLDAALPSWHLDPDCGGLERVDIERRATREFPGPWSLAEDTSGGRICRMCTLESLLRTVLRPERFEAATGTPVTFSSRPDWNAEPTASGQARLLRLAKSLALQTVHVPTIGTVAYGRLVPRALDVLATNLETHPLPWARSTPSAEHLQCYWTLVSDLEAASDTPTRRVLWTSARLLTR